MIFGLGISVQRCEVGNHCILLSSCGGSVVKPTEYRSHLLSGTHIETLHYEGKMKGKKTFPVAFRILKKLPGKTRNIDI